MEHGVAFPAALPPGKAKGSGPLTAFADGSANNTAAQLTAAGSKSSAVCSNGSSGSGSSDPMNGKSDVDLEVMASNSEADNDKVENDVETDNGEEDYFTQSQPGVRTSRSRAAATATGNRERKRSREESTGAGSAVPPRRIG